VTKETINVSPLNEKVVVMLCLYGTKMISQSRRDLACKLVEMFFPFRNYICSYEQVLIIISLIPYIRIVNGSCK
jgi:hypothetical protein